MILDFSILYLSINSFWFQIANRAFPALKIGGQAFALLVDHRLEVQLLLGGSIWGLQRRQLFPILNYATGISPEKLQMPNWKV